MPGEQCLSVGPYVNLYINPSLATDAGGSATNSSENDSPTIPLAAPGVGIDCFPNYDTFPR